MLKVCFVCLGNICRSPTAEGVMRHLVAQAGLAGSIDVDSAGTSGYHVGERPDSRAVSFARKRGIRIAGHARRFDPSDWHLFDYVLAVDRENLKDLERSAPSSDVLNKLALLRDFDPKAPKGSSVPDPYYGGDDGFDEVLDMCEAACRGLLAYLRERHEL